MGLSGTLRRDVGTAAGVTRGNPLMAAGGLAGWCDLSRARLCLIKGRIARQPPRRQ